MAILWYKIKSLNPKKTIITVGLAGLVALILSHAFVAAQGPAFNVFPVSFEPGVTNTDLPLLDIRNDTTGSDFSKASRNVQAAPGQKLLVRIYYHNGATDSPENTARNVIIKAFANPSLGVSVNSHTIFAQISAQNAATVTSAQKGGNVTIQISGGTPQSLSLVPGSTRLLPNQGLTPRPGAQSLPDSVFSSGVNIGDVRGCWQFVGFVTFKLKVSSVQPEGTLDVQKHVKNITAGTGFQDNQVSANPGDRVEYKVVVTAFGNAVQNVSVRDALHPNLNFTGSVQLNGTVVSSAAFFNQGVSIGSLNVGESKLITFQATVASASQLGQGTHTLTNVATAFTASQSVSDGADVIVQVQPQQISCVFTWQAPLVSDGTGRGLRRIGDPSNVQMNVSGLSPNQSFRLKNIHTSGSPEILSDAVSANSQGTFSLFDSTIITNPPYTKTGDYNVFVVVGGQTVASCPGFRLQAAAVQTLDIEKTVRNESTASSFVDLVDAEPGQRVSFKLVVNSGSSNVEVSNVTVSDSLPGKLSFVTGSFNVDGVVQSPGSFFSTGISLGTLQPGQQKVIIFQADIAGTSSFTTQNCEDLLNTATVSASSVSPDSDSATVHVCKPAPVKQDGAPPALPI